MVSPNILDVYEKMYVPLIFMVPILPCDKFIANSYVTDACVISGDKRMTELGEEGWYIIP